MPVCEFSETQFSFGFTFEFVNRFQMRQRRRMNMPFFPSTYMEGRPGYGYDVRIFGSYFFQYKVPFYVSQKRKENTRMWDAHGGKYYKCKINTNDEQFKLLKKLKEESVMNGFFRDVCYVMPEFYQQNIISQHYHNNEIENNSMIFPIESLPNFGSGYHHITYQAGKENGVLFSEPISIKRKRLPEYPIEEKHYRNSSYRIVEEAKNILYSLPKTDIRDVPDFKLVKYVSDILLGKYNILWLPIPLRIRRYRTG